MNPAHRLNDWDLARERSSNPETGDRMIFLIRLVIAAIPTVDDLLAEISGTINSESPPQFCSSRRESGHVVVIERLGVRERDPRSNRGKGGVGR